MVDNHGFFPPLQFTRAPVPGGGQRCTETSNPYDLLASERSTFKVKTKWERLL